MYYWSRRLGLEAGVEQALKHAKEEAPYYWRKALDEGSPLYAFDIEKMKRPRKQVLKLPLAEALHYNNGAYIDEKESKLVVRLGDGGEPGAPCPGESAALAEREGRRGRTTKGTQRAQRVQGPRTA